MNAKKSHEWNLEVAESVRKSFGTATGNRYRMNDVVDYMKQLWREKENLRQDLVVLQKAFSSIRSDYTEEWDETED